MGCQECPVSPEYRKLRVFLVEMALKERRVPSESKVYKALLGFPGKIVPMVFKGPKGKSGIGIKGEKGDAVNIVPRQHSNWKQCVWKQYQHFGSGKIWVSNSSVCVI